MGYSLGGNLTKELDNKNIEKETLTQKLAEVTTDLEKTKEEKQNLTTENEKLTQKTTQQTTEIESVKREREELQTTVNEQKTLVVTMKQNYQRELDKEKTKVEEKDHEILKIKEEFLDILQERNDKLTTAENENNLLKKNYKIISDERDMLKDTVWRLEMKQKNAPIITTSVGVASFGVGAAVGWWLRGRNKNPILPVSIDYGKNTGTPVIPILQKAMIHPDSPYIYSGISPEINTSGALNCSGAYFSTFGNNTGADNAGFPQDRVIRTASGITNSTNTSIDPFVGAFFSYYTDPLQDGQPIREYTPPFMIPTYFLPLIPPDDPSDSPLMKQILKTTGKQFEKYMGGFFEYLKYRVTLTKESHDYSADLKLERDGKIKVVQLKQQKEAVGIKAIQQVLGAKGYYTAPDALVITPSKFTKSALELASKNGVECWDGKRLLEELYKHRYFYPPE